MSGLPTTSENSNHGGVGVALFVFCLLGFLLAIATEAAYLRLADTLASKATKSTDDFDPTPVADLVKPEPKFTPDQVVEIQLAGLADPDISRGIQQCFAFASPGNRQTTGPLPRFAAMVRRAPYSVLMHHQLVLVGASIIEGENALVVVTLLDEREGIHVFQFLLSKQHGENVKDCWMTEAVYSLEQVPNERPGLPATADAPRYPHVNSLIVVDRDINGSTHG